MVFVMETLQVSFSSTKIIMMKNTCIGTIICIGFVLG